MEILEKVGDSTPVNPESPLSRLHAEIEELGFIRDELEKTLAPILVHLPEEAVRTLDKPSDTAFGEAVERLSNVRSGFRDLSRKIRL